MQIQFKIIHNEIENINFEKFVLEYFGKQHFKRNIYNLRTKKNFIARYNVYDGDTVIGCFAIYLIMNNNHKCVLMGPIIVFKNYQRQGVLKKMLCFVENEYKNICDCVVIVGMENIYGKYGYVKCEDTFIKGGVEPYEILYKKINNCELSGAFYLPLNN